MENELTFGEVRSMYFDEDALCLSPYALYRLDVKGDRNYFYLDEEGKPVFCTGVTTITGRTIPKDEFLIKWISQMGYDNAMAYRDERSKYGTLLHTFIAYYLINRKFDLEHIESLVKAYFIREDLNYDLYQWSEDLKKDLLSFAKFVKDYTVRPLAIEISLAYPELGIAGTIDMPCLMDMEIKGHWGEVYKSGENKGKPKETKKVFTVLAIIDFKSGRKSYGGDEYCAAQLRLYKMILDYNFPSMFKADNIQSCFPILIEDGSAVKLFNWSPKDWRTSPDYHLTDQTEAYSERSANCLIEYYRSREKPIEERTKIFYHGELAWDKDVSENYSIKSAPELAWEKIKEETPQEDLESRTWQYLTVDELFEMIAAGKPDEI